MEPSKRKHTQTGQSTGASSVKNSRMTVVSYKEMNMQDIEGNFAKPPGDGPIRVWSLSSPTIEFDDWFKSPFPVKMGEEDDGKNHEITISLNQKEHVEFFRRLEERLYAIIFENRKLLLPKKNPDQITLDSIKHYTAFQMVVKQDNEKAYDPIVKFKIHRTQNKLYRYKGVSESGTVRATTKNISLTDISWKSRVSFDFRPQYLCVYGNGKVACGLVIRRLIVKQPPKPGFDVLLGGSETSNATNRMYTELDLQNMQLSSEVRKYSNGGKFTLIRNVGRFQLPPCSAPFGWSPPMNSLPNDKLSSVTITVNVTDTRVQDFFRTLDREIVSQISGFSDNKDWFRRKISSEDVAANYYRATMWGSDPNWPQKIKLKVYLDGEKATRIWIAGKQDGKYERTDYTDITKKSTIVPVLNINTFSKRSDAGSITLKATDILILEQGGAELQYSRKLEIVDSSDEDEKNNDDEEYITVNVNENSVNSSSSSSNFVDTYFKDAL